MSRRLSGRPSSVSSTLRAPPSAHVSTSCNTKPIHDPPAENGPASHIAPSAHPQSLDTPGEGAIRISGSGPTGTALRLEEMPIRACVQLGWWVGGEGEIKPPTHHTV